MTVEMKKKHPAFAWTLDKDKMEECYALWCIHIETVVHHSDVRKPTGKRYDETYIIQTKKHSQQDELGTAVVYFLDHATTMND